MLTSWNGNIFRVIGHLCVITPVSGEFPAQRPVTRSFDVFFDLRLNQRLSKQSEAGDLRRYRAHYDVIVKVKYILYCGAMASGTFVNTGSGNAKCTNPLPAPKVTVSQQVNWTLGVLPLNRHYNMIIFVLHHMTFRPFNWHCLTEIRKWMINYNHYIYMELIIHPWPNLD